MSRFVRRWANWGGPRESEVATTDFNPETPIQRTDKTDESTSVGSVSGLVELSSLDFEAGAREGDPEFNPAMPTQRTDRTDRTTSVSSVGDQAEHSGPRFLGESRQPNPEISPGTPIQRTDKTDRTTSVSSVSGEQSSLGLESALGGTAADDRQSLLAADVVAMRLDEFATARLRVEVTSDVLGERVVFASDNTKLDPGELLVVYRAAELRELQGLSPDELRAVHRVKKLFAGTILPS